MPREKRLSPFVELRVTDAEVGVTDGLRFWRRRFTPSQNDEKKLGPCKACFLDSRPVVLADSSENFCPILLIFLAGFSFSQPCEIQKEQNLRTVDKRRLIVLWGSLFSTK